VSLRISPEVIDYFKSTGIGWQSRVDETLREIVKRKVTKRKASAKLNRNCALALPSWAR
jgi:hypothetical protein